jgi:anti-sigma B factor antagonist
VRTRAIVLNYRKIFRITRLDDAIATYDSEEEAILAANVA